ncbi:hypothetical protein [Pseudomonas phage LKD16]|uniref:Uncharacterized protein n=1 Tax=Pseudomonas phage LKD16 TaxID=386792 RepID=Q0E665_9CAUD|nr:hypothetical protein PPLKD16_gp01 [Pseudomonas phage LKD16]CAK25934.1 hypothetical protein [Pseudomonas phage LKD16]
MQISQRVAGMSADDPREYAKDKQEPLMLQGLCQYQGLSLEPIHLSRFKKQT